MGSAAPVWSAALRDGREEARNEPIGNPLGSIPMRMDKGDISMHVLGQPVLAGTAFLTGRHI